MTLAENINLPECALSSSQLTDTLIARQADMGEVIYFWQMADRSQWDNGL